MQSTSFARTEPTTERAALPLPLDLGERPEDRAGGNRSFLNFSFSLLFCSLSFFIALVFLMFFLWFICYFFLKAGGNGSVVKTLRTSIRTSACLDDDDIWQPCSTPSPPTKSFPTKSP